MDVSAVKNHIKTKNFEKLYIFTGSEWKVQQVYIHQIAKVMNADLLFVEMASDIFKRTKNKSFISKPICYVVRDDKELMQNEKLYSRILDTLDENTVVILILTTLDKRLKFYKQHSDMIVEFGQLPEKTLIKYIQKEIPLSDPNCKLLIDVCEHDYGRILLEIDKIYNYANYCMRLPNQLADYNALFKLLLQDGVIYKPPYDAIWDLIGAILKGDVFESFRLLRQCQEIGEATMVMLTNLYNNAKAVLQVQCCTSNDIAKSTGLSGWQIKNAKERIGYYSTEELENMLRIIQKVESGIKRGLIDEKIAMEYVLVNVL